MTNADIASTIERAIARLQSAASAYRHGRLGTARRKLDQAKQTLNNIRED